jgi:hypothetical protein
MEGARRREASKRQSGRLAAETGKREMDFSVYVYTCGELLKATGTDYDRFFSLTFATLTWNLINRTFNTSHLCFSHLRWQEDAIRVLLPKTKTNQSGQRRPTPSHVYANPENPAICPILALGLYLAVNTDFSSNRVFPVDESAASLQRRRGRSGRSSASSATRRAQKEDSAASRFRLHLRRVLSTRVCVVSVGFAGQAGSFAMMLAYRLVFLSLRVRFALSRMDATCCVSMASLMWPSRVATVCARAPRRTP